MIRFFYNCPATFEPKVLKSQRDNVCKSGLKNREGYGAK